MGLIRKVVNAEKDVAEAGYKTGAAWTGFKYTFLLVVLILLVGFAFWAFQLRVTRKPNALPPEQVISNGAAKTINGLHEVKEVTSKGFENAANTLSNASQTIRNVGGK
jgi:cell shape-determining protein MreC